MVLEYFLEEECTLRGPKNGAFRKMFESNEPDLSNQIWIRHNGGIDECTCHRILEC